MLDAGKGDAGGVGPSGRLLGRYHRHQRPHHLGAGPTTAVAMTMANPAAVAPDRG